MKRNRLTLMLISLCVMHSLFAMPAHQAHAVSLPELSELRGKAEVAIVQKNYAAADNCFKQQLAAVSKLADNGVQRANVLEDYAQFCNFRGRYTEALSMLNEALKIRRENLWDKHPEIAFTLLDLASIEFATKKYEQAGDHYCEVLTNYAPLLERGAESIFVSVIQTAVHLSKHRDYAKAESLYRAALSTSLSSQTRQRPTLMIRLANSLANQGKNTESAKTYKQALAYIEYNRPWNEKRRTRCVERIRQRLSVLPATDGTIVNRKADTPDTEE